MARVSQSGDGASLTGLRRRGQWQQAARLAVSAAPPRLGQLKPAGCKRQCTWSATEPAASGAHLTTIV